jgi:seryl-tRNA synthetase
VIDLKLLREDPDRVRASQRARGEDPALVDVLLDADSTRRSAISAADNLRAEQKTASKGVGAASADERPALLAHAKRLAEGVKAAEAEQAAAESAFTAAHMAISNIIIDGVPAGGEEDFTVIDTVGEPPAIADPKDHLELGESLGLIDMERGAKVSGSRFYFLTGYGALLQLGVMQLAVKLATENDHTLVIPPVLVRPEVMSGTGFLGAHTDEIYRLEADDLYLTPTRSSTSRRGRAAMPGGRRASAARQAATARTPAESSACTSSTRWRPSSTAGPRTPRRSTSGC